MTSKPQCHCHVNYSLINFAFLMWALLYSAAQTQIESSDRHSLTAVVKESGLALQPSHLSSGLVFPAWLFPTGHGIPFDWT
ncbi:MAG: hypothetical protein NZ772_16795 [Cyanobacteria bacterium]|nr:hypothetical protein [Cyanobacteriota bacterium]MDW8202989.1 hypothetical protein [Cyanobacteriota bacterium SKYGB_h_bin112]